MEQILKPAASHNQMKTDSIIAPNSDLTTSNSYVTEAQRQYKTFDA